MLTILSKIIFLFRRFSTFLSSWNIEFIISWKTRILFYVYRNRRFFKICQILEIFKFQKLITVVIFDMFDE